MRLQILFCLIVVGATVSLGQNPAPAPAFEVASMKSAADPSGLQRLNERPGGLDYHNASLAVLISNAYSIPGYRIIMPAALKALKYDIVTKMPPTTTRADQWLMLQQLLIERLKLGIHREIREIPVFALTVGSKGAKFQPTDQPTGATRRPIVTRSGAVTRVSGKMSIWDLMGNIQRGLDRPIIDMTDLKGYFDISLEWSPDETLPTPGEPDAVNAAVPLPSLTKALDGQLGLKLEPVKKSMEVVVVDHAEKTLIEN